MAEPTLKFVAKLAGVAPVTVSRVVNGSENVAAATREKILAIIRDLDYTPNAHAANLRRKKSSDESTDGSNARFASARKRLRAAASSGVKAPCPTEGPFIFSPEERRALARQITRLHRDLDRLRKHSERIQTSVEIIQETYSRRRSSCAAH